MHLIRLSLLARVLILVLGLALAPALGMAEDDEEPLTVARDGKLFTITITEPMPVEDVLEEIAEVLGAEVEGAEEAGGVGPLKLVRVSLHQALGEIMPKRSFSMKYADGSEDPALIVIAASKTKVAVVSEEVAEEPPPPEDPLRDFLTSKSKSPPSGSMEQGGLGAILTKNPRAKNFKECGELLKLPQNRGKQSETLVTPKGEPCPPGIKIFGN